MDEQINVKVIEMLHFLLVTIVCNCPDLVGSFYSLSG